MSPPTDPHLYMLDDDPAILQGMRGIAESIHASFQGFCCPSELLAHESFHRPGCLILDHSLADGTTGLSLIESLLEKTDGITTIVLSGKADVPITVEYMRAGALSVIEKPVPRDELVTAMLEAFRVDQQRWNEKQEFRTIRDQYRQLTERRRSVLDFVLEGRANKWIANRLEVSDRTIESDRALLLKAFDAENFFALSTMISKMHQFERFQTRPAATNESTPSDGDSATPTADR